MKNTIITEEIDGFQIVKGFYHAIVDPVATRKKTEKEIESDPLMEEKRQLAGKRDALLKKMAPKVQALIAHDKKGNIESPEAKKLIIDLNNMDRQVGDLRGNWLVLFVSFVLLIVNVVGEGFWWRGVILPRQSLAFGRWTWVIHGVL